MIGGGKMMHEPEKKEEFSPYRVLDLTDEKGWLCGKTLGDMGYDVIKIEKPSGDSGRNRGPFYHDIPDSEKSLHWFAFNTSKRGITLDIESPDGKDIFLRLVKTSGFIVESFPPDYMESIGLGYSALSQVNPAIIFCSITPFGPTGPYKDYKVSDLVAMSLGGMVYLNGEPDRAPIRISAEQVFCHAGMQAAIGMLIAQHYRQISGEGQHIDVSAVASVAKTMTVELAYWDGGRILMKRVGNRRRRGNMEFPDIWRCKEGYILWRFMGGREGRFVRRLVEWMDSEGLAGKLKDVEWEKVDVSKVTREVADAWEEVFRAFFLKHTSQEIYDIAIARRIPCCPVYNLREILNYSQLLENDYFKQVEYPELGATITHPGPFCRLTETPWKISRRAPLIGEHNDEIYCKELGIPHEEFITLKQVGVI